MCWPKIDIEGGVESKSRGDTRKDRQQTVGSKAGVEEISGALKTEGESLSENPKGNTHTKCQTTNKPNKQNK